MTTFVRKLLWEIADEIKRPRSDFEKYIADLEANWYSSKEEILKVPDQEFFRLGLPGRLVMLIRDKLGQGQLQPSQQTAQQQSYAPQQYAPQQMPYQQPGQRDQYSQQPQQAPSKQMQQGPQRGQLPGQQQQPKQGSQGYSTQQQPSRIEQLLTQMRKRLNNEQEFLEVTDILKKIFGNIQSNLQVEKYRSIKKGNLLSRLFRYEEIAEIIRLGGFEDGPLEMVMRQLDLSKLNIICDEIERNSRPKFDPYKAQISSITGMMGDLGTDGVSVWADRLEQLQRDREVSGS